MLQREREEFLQPQEDPENVMKMLATAYVQYLAIMRKLDEAHDHLIHQQKRALVRQALDGVMGRILEIKREMVALEYSECHSMAGILMELQRVPVGLPPLAADPWERWALVWRCLICNPACCLSGVTSTLPGLSHPTHLSSMQRAGKGWHIG